MMSDMNEQPTEGYWLLHIIRQNLKNTIFDLDLKLLHLLKVEPFFKNWHKGSKVIVARFLFSISEAMWRRNRSRQGRKIHSIHKAVKMYEKVKNICFPIFFLFLFFFKLGKTKTYTHMSSNFFRHFPREQFTHVGFYRNSLNTPVVLCQHVHFSAPHFWISEQILVEMRRPCFSDAKSMRSSLFRFSS